MREPIVDGHLDLAFNATRGRDLTLSAHQLRALEPTGDRATVTLPELERGGVALAMATLFAEPADSPLARPGTGYEAPEEAQRLALEQLAVYERWEAEGRVRIVRDRASLEAHLGRWQRDSRVGLVVLMEGADPIVSPDDLPAWWARGVRAIGPAWRGTRYSGGTGAPGALTPAGRELVAGMRELGLILDLSHMADEAIADALAAGAGRIMASHSNARALTPTDRHLTDDAIRAVGERDGVVGLVLYNKFLEPRWSREDRRVPVSLADQFRRHAEHVADLVGWERVAVGSDMDGGMGADENPVELDTVADLGRIAEFVPEGAKSGVLGANWLRFLRSALP